MLPARVADYAAEQLDQLCLSGRVAWGRLTPAHGSNARAPLRSSPIALLQREHSNVWNFAADPGAEFTSEAKEIKDALEKRGASFFH